MATAGKGGRCSHPAALGMQSGTIQDRQITASSYWGNLDRFRPQEARLNNTKCWASGEFDHSTPWLQVDLQGTFIITGIQVQGRQSPNYWTNQWVTELQVQSSETEASLAFIHESGTTPKVRLWY